MVFQNARYCNGFPTLRRNSDMLGVSIYSILSDIFLFVPVFSGHKNGHSRRGGQINSRSCRFSPAHTAVAALFRRCVTATLQAEGRTVVGPKRIPVSHTGHGRSNGIGTRWTWRVARD